ncbi:toll-like receptor 3 [Strongylocentrotus purpuratus]|uniref:Uncharacterized protein n=1 Tax=Strongylocentrotus purpuratus TaxID=7668 RepID=A0A7M7T5S0_STRPU|nr:toll-like receptor 3 [Strongylocentrotus purpuratus]
MARMRLIPLLVLLYLLILTATEEMSSQHHGLQLQRLARTRCSQGPYKRKISCTRMELTEVPQDLYPEVEELDLSLNEIRSIFNSSFTRYQRIKNLNISYSKLSEIATGSFYAMPMLQYLDLSKNWSLRSITSQMFNFSINLSHLILSSTGLESVPGDILRLLPNLQLLDLSFTDMLSHINISSCSSKTRILNIVFLLSKIKALVPSRFRIDCEINSLNYKAIKYNSIDPPTIATIRARVLSFPNRRLRPDLWDQFFRGIGMSHIEELLLHATKIARIDQHHFALLRNKPLQVLDVSGNHLPDLTQMGFLDLPLVSTLIIDRCRIKNIGPVNFARMKGLRILHVNHNNIIDINDNIPNLETFVYSDCKKPKWPDQIKQIFNQTKSLKHVIIRNAGLNTLWITFVKNNISLFGGLRTVISLDVKKNPLKRLESGILTDLLLLQELDLSDCELKGIEVNAFEGLQSLQILHLEGNQLLDLPHGVLWNMAYLRNVSLEGNKLKYLDRDLFSNSSKLRNLTLARNQLTGLNHSTFEPILNTLFSIDISENEIACTCNVKWLPLWLSGSITLLNEIDTRCSSASLEELQEKPLMSF